MDDLGCSWPAWKFGLKRDDLFTSLHDQYNTFTFSLQDPEAFHADVYEVSNDADSLDEFHRLMADRRQQRLRELHESLESLAFEIIANPKLMDSEHWNYALQLFRTKSFDSLVRYFASYLPEKRAGNETRFTGSSFSDASTAHTESTEASSVDGDSLHYTKFFDGPVMTEEPLETTFDDKYPYHGQNVPLSPPETDTVVSECSANSPANELDLHTRSTSPSSRSMSFSGSESEIFGTRSYGSIIHDDDDASSQSGSVGTAALTEPDCSESHSCCEYVDDGKLQDEHCVVEDDDDLLTAQFPEDAFDDFDNESIDEANVCESDTPTPRPEGVGTSYIDYKTILCRRLPPSQRRSPSPKAQRSRASPSRDIRRSPEEAYSKIQKPTPDPVRKRAKGRI